MNEVSKYVTIIIIVCRYEGNVLNVFSGRSFCFKLQEFIRQKTNSVITLN